MKKIICLLTAILFLISFSGCSYIYQYEETPQKAYNPTEIHITVDNRPIVMSKPSEKTDGHVLVPMREFSKLIGAEVYWDNEAHTASVWRRDYFIEFSVRDREYWSITTSAVSGAKFDIEPRIINDTLYVPLRTMAENLDFLILWEKDTNTIALTDKKTEIETGYANTTRLFLSVIDKYVEKSVSEFTVITENLPIETLETDIRDYFDDIKSQKYILQETSDGKIKITYKLNYHMHARILHAHRINDTKELDEYEKAVYRKALQIVSEHTAAYMTDYEKELSLHDYIAKNTRYSYEALEAISRGDYNGEASTPYGTLINGSAICGGYSETFKLLLELSGIECDIVHGTADGEGHAWNRVKLGGKYYLVDVTWNDPDDESLPDFIGYDYFNLTDEKMNQDHFPASISEKKADTTLYNYYYYNSLLVEN